MSEIQAAEQLTLSFKSGQTTHSVTGSEEAILFLARRFNINMLGRFSVTQNGEMKVPHDYALDDDIFNNWEQKYN